MGAPDLDSEEKIQTPALPYLSYMTSSGSLHLLEDLFVSNL